ncbi:Crp/Fnr family transcriptional regulator [Chelativorans sp. AA-79]|uniref:Crp/Fnr family transcriptional regulator n=1 Tax=Chelativorans sp. AA-79 TaxID=3028735 RepID=UPI0023F61B65|nr:Crp/Fnr family transcriptional regulator [Chelativorans sp. AA-79]WEX10492.1 Crp/Fnr family transcriptional regulator [Chelativorans sp. AA-79]
MAASAGNRRTGGKGPDVWRRVYEAGDTISNGDGNKEAFFLVSSGWVASGKMLTSGARIVLDFLLPGDVVGIGTTEWAREVVTALSPATVFEFPGAPLERLLTAPRELSAPILKGIARRNARIAEHMASIGRRGAVERTAHLLLELAHRLGAKPDRGRVRFSCPLTQSDLADALGLTAVHVNRVLKDLRESGFVSFRNGTVEIHNIGRLADFVGFDTSYLTLRGE